MRNRKFNARVQSTELTYPVIDFLKYNLDILQNESNILVDITFWYDKTNMNISPELIQNIANVFDISKDKIHDRYPKTIFKNAMFSISYSKSEEQYDALSHVENDSKFYLFYDDESSFIRCIIELFSFIKAKLNYEVTKNEKTRYSRK